MREQKFKNQIKSEQPNLLNRKIFGERFNSFINAYPLKSTLT